ncbi:two-component system response regulator [Paenibacillus sp. 32O-W]|uniref:helix-turn-helix domain-containing protein n=1 Tax=Paenibacillus sp. 32O-W TaxID=1695218 RepID=UPI00071EE3AC|nr:helix-turn-helix domain-containing protein [Paenibacillus sp. 32O-W]ALS26416.1 two-component system response regulator [Paenibacillus sp. 32O-W]
MRVMIVDDEVIIRTGLAKVIKWHELGLELLPPAASGEEAMSRLMEERPNILLTDIRMTGMDGLTLAKEAKRLLPNIEVIILSGYDDFKYTQQAIRNDVTDYLLKTTRPEEIIKTVLKVKHRIEEKWAAQSEDCFKNKEARNRLFERWVVSGDTNGIEPRLLYTMLPRLFPEQDGPADDPLQIVFVSGEGWEREQNGGGVSLLLFAIENMMNDLLPCETLLQPDRVVAAMRVRPGDAEAQTCLASMIASIERLLKCKAFAAVGKTVTEARELHESYRTAEQAYGYKGLIDDPICRYWAIKDRKGKQAVFTGKEEVELYGILLEDDSVALKEWVHRFVHELTDGDEFTLESLEASMHAVAISAQRWIEKVQHVSGRSGADVPRFRFKTGTALKDALFQYLYVVMKLYHNSLSEGQAAHVHKAKAFIELHLGGDVGLQRVAKHVHLHPSHLSEVFKKEVGMTFTDYVLQQRMRHAAEILTTSPAKISDVAGSVGYEDVKYFSQMFKKYYGKTPSEFREDASKHGKND